MARQQECGYCVPTWNLTDLTVTALPYRIQALGRGDVAGGVVLATRITVNIIVEWKACLKKLECSPLSREALMRQQIVAEGSGKPSLPRFPVGGSAAGLVGGLRGVGSPMEGYTGSFEIPKGIEFKGLADLGQAQVCCDQKLNSRVEAGECVEENACCCLKKEHICACYASYSNSTINLLHPATPTTQDECCMEGKFEHTIETVDPTLDDFQNTRDVLTNALQNGNIKGGLAAKLQDVLKPIAGRGTDSTADCNGIDLDDATSQWDPEAFRDGWPVNCVCVQAVGGEMQCP